MIYNLGVGLRLSLLDEPPKAGRDSGEALRELERRRRRGDGDLERRDRRRPLKIYK